jgi:MtN3 and saliva related transmembrane protein
MAMITEIIGFTAAAVGTSLMLPQVIKSIKTKRVNDISFAMLILYFFNCLLWLIYGILIIAWPVIICNFIALIISIIQLILKQKYTSIK